MFFITFFLSFLFFISLTSASAAIGVDLGTEYIRAVCYSSPTSSFQVVENAQGDQKTPTAIAFRDKVRTIGDDALSLYKRKPNLVILDPKRLLGKKYDCEERKVYEKLFPHTKLLKDEHDGAILISPKEAPEESYRAEELISAIIESVRIATVNTAAFQAAEIKEVSEAVITAPSYFSALRREALQTAFELGGLRVARVIDELGAAAIDFAALHLPTSGPHSELVVVYGAGVTGVSAALMRVEVNAAGRIAVHVLAEEADGTVGGADLDVLVEQLADKQYAAMSGGRTLREVFGAARVHGELRRVKEVCLTQEACRWLMTPDDDPSGKLDVTLHKSDVSAAVAPLMVRMAGVLERLLARVDKLNGVRVADIGSVELFGGTSRFAALQAQLSAVAEQHGLRIGHRLNTELSAAQGAALLAASISDDAAPRRVTYERRCLLPEPALNDAPALSAERRAELETRIAAAVAREKARELAAEARNTLETFLIESKAWLIDLDASDDADVQAAIALVTEQRDWLDYGSDTAEAGVEEFAARLERTSSALAPLKARKPQAAPVDVSGDDSDADASFAKERRARRRRASRRVLKAREQQQQAKSGADDNDSKKKTKKATKKTSSSKKKSKKTKSTTKKAKNAKVSDDDDDDDNRKTEL